MSIRGVEENLQEVSVDGSTSCGRGDGKGSGMELNIKMIEV